MKTGIFYIILGHPLGQGIIQSRFEIVFNDHDRTVTDENSEALTEFATILPWEMIRILAWRSMTKRFASDTGCPSEKSFLVNRIKDAVSDASASSKINPMDSELDGE